MKTVQTLYRSAICRALLNAAKLEHYWTGKGIRADALANLDALRAVNPTDAVLLSLALALCSDGHQGPTVAELRELPEPLRTLAETSLTAVKGSKLAQVWLAWTATVLEIAELETLADS